MLQSIFGILKELLGFSKQVSENKGERIKLTEAEIRQRSQNTEARLQDKGYLKKWMAQLNFLDENLHARERLHSKNQLRELVRSDAEILSIELTTRIGFTGNWVEIAYMRDTYKRSYFVKAKD